MSGFPLVSIRMFTALKQKVALLDDDDSPFEPTWRMSGWCPRGACVHKTAAGISHSNRDASTHDAGKPKDQKPDVMSTRQTPKVICPWPSHAKDLCIALSRGLYNPTKWRESPFDFL